MKTPSYSRVNSILNCPKKYNGVGFTTSKAFTQGLKLHKILEDYIEHGFIDNIVMDEIDRNFIKKINKTLELKDTDRVISEYAILEEEFKGFIDLIVIDDIQKTVGILDLKTINDGRKASYKLEEGEQMRLYAYWFNRLQPQFLEAGYTIHIGYILYLKNSKQVRYDFLQVTPEELETTWSNFQKKIDTAYHIIDNENWYAHKNEYCGFCPLKNECKGVK